MYTRLENLKANNYKNLENCINILKNFYNISPSNNLTLLIIDINSDNIEKQKTLYEFYYSLFSENELIKLNAEEKCINIIKNDIPKIALLFQYKV